jgi:Domain of unknown function (DUF4157)
MIAIHPIATPRRTDDVATPAPARGAAAGPILRRAAAAPARAPAAAQPSERLRAAIRALAPQLGGAAAPRDAGVGGLFGQAINAGIHDVGALGGAGQAAMGALGGAAANPLGALESAGTAALGAIAPGIAGAITQLRTALPGDLRAELEQLVRSPAGLAVLAQELASAASGSSSSSDSSSDGDAPASSSASGGTVARRGAGDISDAAPAALADAAAGAAAPLPAALRRRFETALATDLGGVRVHTDGPAASAATAFGAHAFAQGQDIYFAAGQYRPGTRDGDHLIAHEVAHTVQQRATPTGPQYQLAISEPGDALEAEADRAADAMVASHLAPEGAR